MNLQEIQERAINYRILLSNPKGLREQRKAATPIQPTKKAIRGPKRDLSERAHELLDGIDAISSLEAIRDEAWHEGKIVEFGRGMVDGRFVEWVLRLESEPFKALQVTLAEKKRVQQIRLDERTTSLDVIVKLEKGRMPKVAVVNEGIYAIERQAKPFNFSEDVTIHGLSEVWHRAELKYYLGNVYPWDWSHRMHTIDWGKSFNPRSPLGKDELCVRLYNDLHLRQSYHGFPSQIRQWCDKVVNLFPTSLRERGEMSAEELREWGYKIRETPRWLRFFDRRFLGFLG